MPRVDISYRRIVDIAGPVLVTNFSYTMMGVIDTVMVGRLGVPALAAVGLANLISFSLLSFFWGLSSGINTLTAQAYGARDRDAVARSFFQGLYLAILSGLVVLAAIPAVRAVLVWVDASPEVERLAREYIDVRLWGGLTITVLWACDNFYRGLGRTTVMMWCGMAQMVLNCVFNWVFIFGTATVHVAHEVAGRMLACELYPAAKSGLGGDVQQCRVLSNPGAGETAERERIVGPEEGCDRGGIETFGHLRRHLGKVGAEGCERGFLVGEAGFDSEKIGDDAGFAGLIAARVPQILKTEIGIEGAVRRRRQARVGTSPHA